MAHFAELNGNNIVIRVIVVHNNELLDENGTESEQKGIDFCVNLLGGVWVQTSYNASKRFKYAGIGDTYDATRDAFIPIKPFESWTLNESTCKWEAPTPMPTEEGKFFTWNEATLSWDEVTN